MIFQINYKTDRYDGFYRENQEYIPSLNYKLYDTDGVEYFLNHYGYMTKFRLLKIEAPDPLLVVPILCDFIRVAILYEFGGIYLDSDIIFREDVVSMEDDLDDMYGDKNVLLLSRSLHFIRGISKSRYMKYIMDKYNNSPTLFTDAKVLKSLNFTEFRDDMTITTDKIMDKYFIHSMITGNEISKKGYCKA